MEGEGLRSKMEGEGLRSERWRVRAWEMEAWRVRAWEMEGEGWDRAWEKEADVRLERLGLKMFLVYYLYKA